MCAMGLKFRLRGLAETFIDEMECPTCGQRGSDEEQFSTELTRVTFEGIIAVVQCRECKEIFVPATQRLGVVDPRKLREAVEKDAIDTGEAILPNFDSVKMCAEKLNADRKGSMQ